MKKIPLTNNWVSDFQNTIGSIEFNDTAKASFVYEMLKMRPDSFKFEVGYTVNDNGEFQLTEVSLVNKYPEYHPAIVKRRAEDYVLRASRKIKNLFKD